jgi:hypothetical protein
MKRQGYKDRMDEKYGKKSNERYMSKGIGGKVMGHDSAPKSCNVPVGEGWSEVKPFKSGNLGYPSQAFDYKY